MPVLVSLAMSRERKLGSEELIAIPGSASGMLPKEGIEVFKVLRYLLADAFPDSFGCRVDKYCVD